MAKRLSLWLYRFSTGRRTLFFLLIFVFFSALILPSQTADADAYSAGVGSPDLSFMYSSEDLYKMAETYGEEGRDAYVRARFTFDLIWPIVYTLSLTTAISWLFVRGIATYSGLRGMNLLPILGMLFDYLENASTSIVMLRYPAITSVIDWLAPVFTAFKWTSIAGSFVLLLLGAVFSVKRRLEKR